MSGSDMELEVLVDGEQLRIVGNLTIYNVNEARDELFPAVRARGGEALIELSGVSEIDTAGVQVLLMIHRLSRACGARFALLNPSGAAQEALRLCGLDSLIELESRP